MSLCPVCLKRYVNPFPDYELTIVELPSAMNSYRSKLANFLGTGSSAIPNLQWQANKLGEKDKKTRNGTFTATTATNIFTYDKVYYTLGRPHEYLDTYPGPIIINHCYDPDDSNPNQEDGDGVGNICDNRLEDYNPGQEDNDTDGPGDVFNPDDDNDTILNVMIIVRLIPIQVNFITCTSDDDCADTGGTCQLEQGDCNENG